MSRTSLRLVPLLAACGLAACTAGGPSSSYVAPLSSPSDAETLASGIGAFLTTQLPAASTTIVLDPTPVDQADNGLTPILAGELRRRGFAVADGNATANAHTLRYWVTPLDTSGELVRLLIDGRKSAARLFARTATGVLHGGGPFTVLQSEAS